MDLAIVIPLNIINILFLIFENLFIYKIISVIINFFYQVFKSYIISYFLLFFLIKFMFNKNNINSKINKYVIKGLIVLFYHFIFLLINYKGIL